MRTKPGSDIRIGDTIEWLGPRSAIPVATIIDYPAGGDDVRIALSAPDSTGYETGITLYPEQSYRVQ
jgi:hypothetical protein